MFLAHSRTRWFCIVAFAVAIAGRPTVGWTAQAATAESEGDHKGSHSHHDATDLSHQNAGPQQESPSEFKSDLAIWTFVVFLLLLVLLTKFAWRPIMDGLEKRESGIAQQIAEAKQSADKAAAQLRQYEVRMAAAGDEAREIVSRARREAETRAAELLAEAKEDMQRERERAVAEIAAAKNAAVQELAQQSVNLAVTLAGRLARKEIRREEHSQLISEALERFPSRN